MGNNFDYTTHAPRMPQFREPSGDIDWRQGLDMILPGDWWNSQTNQWKPLGIASGVTGLPIEGAVSFGRGIGNAARSGANFLRGIGRGGTRAEGVMPDFSSSFSRIGNDAANYLGGRNSTDLANSNVVRQTRDTVSDINDFRRGGQQQRGRGGSAGGGNMGGVTLGLGQLGRGGDEALLAFNQSVANRNGALMER